MTIPKSERAELRSVVRQQFKVLRSEVAQRKAELLADVEAQVADHYSEDDAKWQGVLHVAQEAASEANRRINDALYEAGYEQEGPTERALVKVWGLSRPPDAKRTDVRVVAASRIEAQVRGALLALERQEADLLRSLAVDALESDEARSFLGRIPTVGELVPSVRLAELASAIDVEGSA